MKPLMPALLFLALLTGCADMPGAASPAGQGRLTLNETLTIPPNAATVRVQYGRVVPFNSVQEQDPFCVFEINTVAETEQAVRPGSFAITRVVRSIETFAGMPVFPYFPAFRPVRVGHADGGGSPSHIYYKTTFRLLAADQPVRTLTCMSNQMAPGIPIMRHLTLAEMRQALGKIFTLEFPS
jgi:hypothetical protein